MEKGGPESIAVVTINQIHHIRGSLLDTSVLEDNLLARTLARTWARSRLLEEVAWKELLQLRYDAFGRLTRPQRDQLWACLIDPERVRRFLRGLVGTGLLKPGLSTEDEESR